MDEIQEKQPPDVLTSDTENRTRIEPQDAPEGQREKYRVFRAYNTGMWNGPRRENKQSVRRQDNLHRFDSLASRLDLTTYQKKRGRHLVDELNFANFSNQTTTADMVMWAICVAVANADVPGGMTRYWPLSSSKRNESLIGEVAATLNMDTDKQMSVLQRVLARTDL